MIAASGTLDSRDFVSTELKEHLLLMQQSVKANSRSARFGDPIFLIRRELWKLIVELHTLSRISLHWPKKHTSVRCQRYCTQLTSPHVVIFAIAKTLCC